MQATTSTPSLRLSRLLRGLMNILAMIVRVCAVRGAGMLLTVVTMLLTAARKRLRDARKAAAAAEADAAAADSVNRSPHAKASYDAAELDALAKRYEALKWRLIQKPGGSAVKPDEFYELYACVGPLN